MCIRDDMAVGRIDGHAFHMFCCVVTSSLNVVIPSRLKCAHHKSKLIYASEPRDTHLKKPWLVAVFRVRPGKRMKKGHCIAEVNSQTWAWAMLCALWRVLIFMLNVSGCRSEHAANLKILGVRRCALQCRESLAYNWSCGAVGKRCELGESIHGGNMMIEGEGQKQGQLHGKNAKQEENGERVDFI